MKQDKRKLICTSFLFGACVVSFTALLSSCKKDSFTVTYHATEGFTVNGQQDFIDDNVKTIKYEVAPDPDPREESKFVGWYTTSDYSGEKLKNFPITVTSNMNLYAKWVGDYSDACTVQFKTGGGTPVSDAVVKKNEAIYVAPHTSKTDYKFLGWYESEDAPENEPVQFPYYVSQNCNLIAKWKKESYRPLFVTIGEKPEGTKKVSGLDNTYQLETGVKVLKTAPYTYDMVDKKNFAGWYLDSDYKNFASFPLKLEKDIYLYAKFEDNGYDVTLEDDTVEDPETHGPTKVELNNCKTIAYPHAAITSHPDKVFVGWKNGENLITKYPIEISSDTTLTAYWEDKTQVDVTYKANGKEIKKIKHDKDTLLNDDYTPEGEFLDYFSFNGWCYGGTEEKVHFPITVSNDITLEANLKRKCFDVEILDIETNRVIATSSKSGGIEAQPKIIVPGRESDYTLDRYLYSDKTPIDPESGYPIRTDDIHIDKETNKLTLIAKWIDSKRKHRITIDYGGDFDSYYFYPDKAMKVKDLEKKHTDDRHIKCWIDLSNMKELEDEDDLNWETRDINLKAVWEGNFAVVNVFKYGTPYDETTIHLITDGHFNKLNKLNQIKPDYTGNNYVLDGYYTSDDGETFSKDPLPLETVYKDAPFKYFKEHWTLKNANVKLVYPDGSFEYKNNVSLNNFDPSKYYDPSKISDDYRIYGFTFKDQKYNWLDVIKELDTHDAEKNTIEILAKKVKFKVTFDLNYDGSPQRIHEVSNCETVPTFNPTREKYILDGWYYDNEFKNKVDHEKILTEDITVYAKWEIDSSQVNVTFDVGSSQLGAAFEDGTKAKELAITLPFNDFPKCYCDDCEFIGWYDGEGQDAKLIEGDLTSGNLPASHKLYARWQARPGCVTVGLKVENDGKFKTNNNDIYLATVKENSTFGSITSKIPGISYPGDEFKVSGWSTSSGGSLLTNDYVFSKNQFIYAVAVDNVQTPKSFENDNWVTVAAVAENKITKADGTNYSNGLQALKTIYGLSVGDKKEITFNGEKDPYIVRVAGLGQDYANAKRTTRLPLTLEFTTIPVVSSYGSSDSSLAQNTWSTCDLKTKLNQNGEIYNCMPLGLRKENHIKTVYKATNEISAWDGSKTITATMSENKLFIPTFYEINIPNATRVVSNKNNIDFLYQVYVDQGKSKTSSIIRKQYGEIGYCCYWCRNSRATSGSDNEYIYISKNAQGDYEWDGQGSFVTAGRGISPFFCLGKSYIP